MDHPTRLGNYILLKKLDSGPAVDSYLARPIGRDVGGSEVLVRRLHERLCQSAEIVEFCRREARTAITLVHPNVERLFEFVQLSETEVFLVAEYVWGESLRRIAERGMTVGRVLPIELACRLGADIVEGLAYIHGKKDPTGRPLGLTHRNVSPSNIVIGFDGQVKLTHFGLGQLDQKADEDLSRKSPPTAFAYLSPEQVEGLDVDARSDLFSLGATLYETTTRKRLFRGRDAVTTMKLVSEAAVPAPSESIPSFPPNLERLVLKALSKDRDKRYANALELRDDLLACVDKSKPSAGSDEIADYMRGIFPDRIKELEQLLGEGYQGPDPNVWPELFGPREPKDTRAPIPAPAPTEKPEQRPSLPPLPTPASGPREEVPDSSLSTEGWDLPELEVLPEDEVPDETAPARPEPRPQPAPIASDLGDGEIRTAEHTLRKDHPDSFEMAADTSRKFISGLAAIMVVLVAVIVVLWVKFDYIWEGAGEGTGPPEAEELPPPTLPETVAIGLSSVPPGAAVAVNGVIALQRTPGTFEVVPNATNTFAFYMDGFATKVVDVDIGVTPPDEELSVSLVELVQPPDWIPPEPDPDSDAPVITEWSPPMGRMNVVTQPEGATILLNGRDVCRAPCEFEVIAEQEQHITARLPTYLDTVTMSIAPTWDEERDTRYLSLILRQPASPRGQYYCYFDILGSPLGAVVHINDELAGRTQLRVQRRIDALQRIEITADEYHPWTRSFYPSPGRFQLNPILSRILHGAAQLSLYIDTPGLETTTIYLGPNEIGVGSIENYEIDGGTYELTLSYSPPPEVGEGRRRSRIEVELPPGTHVTEHYVWDGSEFTLSERTEEPLPEEPE